MRVGDNRAPPPLAVSFSLNSVGGGPSDIRGKHRIQADLNRLDHQTRFLQEELEQLEKMEKASAACKGILSNVETKPDPLLPLTNGPLNAAWDRWFEGPQDSKRCRCWIL